MDEFQNAGGWQPEKPASPPPPPPPPREEVKVRTMGSDVKSISEGESAPVPEAVLLPPDESEPVFKPETIVKQAPSNLFPSGEAPKKSGRKAVLFLAGIVIVAGFGFAGYFFVYPILFPETPPPEAPAEQSSPPPPLPQKHQSYFLSSPAERAEIRLETVSAAALVESLKKIEASTAGGPVLQEIAVLDMNANQIPWASVFAELTGGKISAERLAPLFRTDFTAWLYHDGRGVWPGFAAKLQPTISLTQAKEALQPILEDPQTASLFYLAPPGTLSEFKDGQIFGQPLRYAMGSAPGAAFNYGFVQNFLFITTSYDGGKAAAERLEF